MRAFTLSIAIALLISTAQAQQPAQPPKLFTSSADIAALIAKAKADRKPDQANFIQTVVREAPYQMNLEYRAAGVASPASVHEHEAELFVVVEGSGTITTGGKLHDEKRTNATNLSGTGIDGGTPRRVAKGDVILVPENTPHGFTDIDGALVLMSLHVPQPSPAAR